MGDDSQWRSIELRPGERVLAVHPDNQKRQKKQLEFQPARVVAKVAGETYRVVFDENKDKGGLEHQVDVRFMSLPGEADEAEGGEGDAAGEEEDEAEAEAATPKPSPAPAAKTPHKAHDHADKDKEKEREKDKEREKERNPSVRKRLIDHARGSNHTNNSSNNSNSSNSRSKVRLGFEASSDVEEDAERVGPVRI